jgi:hypothetical protein
VDEPTPIAPESAANPTTLALHDVARAAQRYVTGSGDWRAAMAGLEDALDRLHATGWRVDGPERVEAPGRLTGAGRP